MEIGSIYEIAPEAVLPAGVTAPEKIRLEETEKYKKSYIRFTASGREAIALALEGLERNHPQIEKRCILPAYMCDTVFLPFERAGWEIHFYSLNKELEADEKKLGALIEAIRPGLLFIHPYYGVDTWKPMRSLLHTWRQQGICIMEDVTQSYYLKDAGREADYVVGSLRKWYAVPDGGFVAADEPLPVRQLLLNQEMTAKRMELSIQKWKYLHEEGSPEEKQTMKTDFLAKNRSMEEWLDKYEGIRALSPEAAAILGAAQEEEAKKQRNENYRCLYQHIVGKTQFAPILREEPEAAPLYLAIYAKDRDGLQGYLRQRGVYAPVLWPVGRENRDVLTQEERYIYEHMLALPIDQRYGAEEMEYAAGLLEAYEKEHTQVIGIRADANDTVATGHIMRCITIAGQLRQRGCRVVFFTADEYPAQLLTQAEMDYVCLNTDWKRMEEETVRLREELVKAGCMKLLIDSYQVTEKYFDDLRDVCRLIYIDDCFEGVYPADMIINYNAYHVRFPYKEAYARNKRRVRLLLGTSYVPLREEFHRSAVRKSAAEREGLQVLLSSGGGDVHNALSGILRELAGEESLRMVVFHVIVGRFNSNREELEQLAAQYPNIMLHYQINHMAQLMGQCTAAVSAAGTVLFELSAMQVPTVFFVCADNQQYDSEFFAKENRMLFAGDIRVKREQCLSDIRSCLKKLLEDEPLRQEMRKALREVTDGNGAAEIAGEILKL